MAQIDKNTVSAENQHKRKSSVFYENENGTGKRILFAGNSITLHGYKPEIGWYGVNYGMAASSKENDYVHIVMNEVRKSEPDAACCICQVSGWERQYKNGSDILPDYEKAHEFKADIIIMRLIENCSGENFEDELFANEYKNLIDYFNCDGKAEVILTTGFWKHKGDSVIADIGKERGYKTVYLGNLGEDDNMKAIGRFEHNGVANHPGDKGMKKIASMILEAIIID